MVYFVVTGHNCESYIDDCVKSVLCQTIPNWSIIIIDDASEDKTFDIALKYSSKYPEKIRVFKKGVYHSDGQL